MKESPVALITGAAHRIGAHTAHTLHGAGYNLALHYRGSAEAAKALCENLNRVRPQSAVCFQADLGNISQVRQLAQNTQNHWDRIDLLVNNASSFYPTPLESCDEQQWDDLINSNLKGPFFLCQALAGELSKQQGAIVNIADIHGDQPLHNHPIYCMAKAGNRMMTRSLARELAPYVRVNGIAPGAILWPEQNKEYSAELNSQQKQNILDKVPLKRLGDPEDIAQAILFLAQSGSYVTGQIITVDGGKSC